MFKRKMKPKGLLGDAQKKNGVSDMQKNILGLNYDYGSRIKSPSMLNMRSDGNFSALADNIGGLIGYVSGLVNGNCGDTMGKCTTTTGKPLGTKFWVDTPATCTDKKTGKKVKRSIYINNVPDGNMKLIPGMASVSFGTEFTGLVPGLMSNIASMNPMQILLAFTGKGSTCQKINMPTIDSDDKHDFEARFITNRDISLMDSSWFPNGNKPSDLSEIEKFQSNISNSSIKKSKKLNISKVDYSKMPNDILIQVYYSCLGLLGIYFLLHILFKQNNKK